MASTASKAKQPPNPAATNPKQAVGPNQPNPAAQNGQDELRAHAVSGVSGKPLPPYVFGSNPASLIF
eukprot:COSAG02_NODE_4203_length_5629_cov_3.527667_8_plen_67_part_00